jgi:hypothetical protein
MLEAYKHEKRRTFDRYKPMFASDVLEIFVSRVKPKSDKEKQIMVIRKEKQTLHHSSEFEAIIHQTYDERMSPLWRKKHLR